MATNFMGGFDPNAIGFAPIDIPNIDFAGIQAAIDQANAASANVANVTQANAGGGGGRGGGGGVPAAPATPKPTADTTEESLKKTSEYADYLRRRQAAEELFKAGQGTEKTRYEQDYGKALENLGWLADKNTWDQGELMSSGQKATTAGRAFNTLRNDYAARGMARSGAKQVAEALLRNQLGNQLSEQEKAKTRFGEDQASKLAAFTAEQDTAARNALTQAKQAVLDRYAADLAAWSGA